MMALLKAELMLIQNCMKEIRRDILGQSALSASQVVEDVSSALPIMNPTYVNNFVPLV